MKAKPLQIYIKIIVCVHQFKVQDYKPSAHYDIDLNLISVVNNSLTLFKLKFQRGTVNPETLNDYKLFNLLNKIRKYN